MRFHRSAAFGPLTLSLLSLLSGEAIAAPTAEAFSRIAESALRPVVQQFDLPGMAVAVTVDGQRYFYNEGVASRDTRRPIDAHTLFEVGSVSKTYTATLAAYAHVTGRLSWGAAASHYLPALRGSAFDHVSVLDLATHASGLQLQAPEAIKDNRQLMAYYRNWQPHYRPGTRRTYSNLGTGMLGMIAAERLGAPFETLLVERLFPALGLQHTYLRVPQQQMSHYAQGYTRDDQPVRVTPGVLDNEAYGIKTTSSDLLHYLEANLHTLPIDPQWQQALTATRTGYLKANDTVQALMWETYPYPVTLATLVQGNSNTMIEENLAISRLTPAQQPKPATWVNKTGSTAGFAAYVAFVPEKKLGIVVLANKWYPNEARVRVAYDIVNRMQ